MTGRNEDTIPTQGAGASGQGRLRKVVVGAAAGTFIEWYDYGIYGATAVTIGSVIFTAHSAVAEQLATFAVFAIAFFVRPLGGAIAGRLGDTMGRKQALAAIVILMSVATALMGMVPGTAAIGIWAPILFICLRLLQGLSAGGEIAGAITFVAEHSPEGRRGLYTSGVNGAAAAGGFCGVLFGTALELSLSEQAMNAWGWRIPFLIALPLGLIGLYIRMRLGESPSFTKIAKAGRTERRPVLSLFSRGGDRKGLGLAIGIEVMNAVTFYILLTYTPTYLDSVLSLPAPAVLGTTAVITLILLLGIPLMGALSDRVGRRPVLLGGCVGFVVLVYPCYLLITQGSFFVGLAGAGLLALLVSVPQGVTHITLTELFPTQVRWTYYAIGLNVSVAVFGSTAPFFTTLLVGNLGSAFGPALYVTAAAVVTAGAVLLSKETANRPLRDDAPPEVIAPGRPTVN